LSLADASLNNAVGDCWELFCGSAGSGCELGGRELGGPVDGGRELGGPVDGGRELGGPVDGGRELNDGGCGTPDVAVYGCETSGEARPLAEADGYALREDAETLRFPSREPTLCTKLSGAQSFQPACP
jgi:hypothetical protein